MVKVMKSKNLVPEGLVPRNIHVKYESPSTQFSKVMVKVKVSADKPTLQLRGLKSGVTLRGC